MTQTPHGKHLIAGSWVGSERSFTSDPVSGPGQAFSDGGAAEVGRACAAADAAFAAFAARGAEARAAFLNTIADEIEARGAAITAAGTAETGLPEARLEGERGRTCGQLRMFADYISAGRHLEARHDPALPDRAPMPRPELRLIQRPIGPVAVFGASNFPLAFSTAGGDTAAALAAGCPVVVKGHPAHPATSELVAEAILAAITACDMPEGCFSLVQSAQIEAGAALVQDPHIQAVGFTGSLRAGRALFDLCAARPVPIPFFGELGSINPVFVLPQALSARGDQIASGWAGSLTMGAGQFCTNPGVLILPEGDEADAFVAAAQSALADVPGQTMLTKAIASGYQAGRAEASAQAGVTTQLMADCGPRSAGPALLQTDAQTWLSKPDLAEEVFGPMGIVIMASGAQEMLQIAQGLQGQLTATLQMEDGDTEAAQQLMPWLERKAGRILVNGFPTGVEVADAMVHGGPYPASTNFGATSVGTLAIRRFLRPVCYQDVPEALVPTGG